MKKDTDEEIERIKNNREQFIRHLMKGLKIICNEIERRSDEISSLPSKEEKIQMVLSISKEVKDKDPYFKKEFTLDIDLK